MHIKIRLLESMAYMITFVDDIEIQSTTQT